jgi:hypothetical protein
LSAGSARAVQKQKFEKRQRSRYPLTALPSGVKSPAASAAPLPLPIAPSAPAWLQLLLKVQRGSSIASCVLVAITLAAYGWTVYLQQLWAQDYRKLENLQRQERQITAASEVLKDQIAREAEHPESGLVIPAPSTTVFLPAASPRPATRIAPAPAAVPPPSAPLAY